MTPEQAAAYVHAQSVAALATIEGMKAENKDRVAHGYTLAYDEAAFTDVINSYGLHHNAIVETFRNANQ